MRIINAYGPSETVCAVTAAEITEGMHDPLPIGELSGAACEIRVADENGNPIRGDESGELVIIGESVARYCGTERGGFGTLDGKPCFYTGDICKAENGLLYFLHRRDRQVKIMGHRIELSDIENNLLRIKGIKQAVAYAEPRGDSGTITAAVRAENGMTEESIRSKLSETLPAYMLPRKIKLVDIVPLNANGKTDRRALNER